MAHQINTVKTTETIPDNEPDIIDRAVAALSPQQQKVWIMSRRQRIKYEEIAKELSISKDAVNKYLQTANKNITLLIRKHMHPLFWVLLAFLQKK